MKNRIQTLAKEIIKYNCDILNISIPLFSLQKAIEFPTLTTQSATSLDGNKIIYNENYIEYHTKNPLQLWVCLSHECRHIWQLKNINWKNEFIQYQSSAELELQAYNNQLPEIDAWAWACLVMYNKFKIKVDLSTVFDKNICEKISDRIHQLNNN